MTIRIWQFDNAETGETITRELTEQEVAALVETESPLETPEEQP
jgi:hypothetical protein